MLSERCMHEVNVLMERYPALETIRRDVTGAIELLVDCYRSGGKILVCGNGGSAADSLHIVGELMKSFVRTRRIAPELQAVLKEQWGSDADYYIENLEGSMPAISLVNEVSLITAYSNDKAPDLAFAQQVLGHGRPGDVLLAISTSGNSANVIHAARIARTMGVKVISLTGEGGGKLSDLSDVLLAVPSKITYQIQEYHLPIYHTMCLAMEAELFC